MYLNLYFATKQIAPCYFSRANRNEILCEISCVLIRYFRMTCTYFCMKPCYYSSLWRNTIFFSSKYRIRRLSCFFDLKTLKNFEHRPAANSREIYLQQTAQYYEVVVNDYILFYHTRSISLIRAREVLDSMLSKSYHQIQPWPLHDVLCFFFLSSIPICEATVELPVWRVPIFFGFFLNYVTLSRHCEVSMDIEDHIDLWLLISRVGNKWSAACKVLPLFLKILLRISHCSYSTLAAAIALQNATNDSGTSSCVIDVSFGRRICPKVSDYEELLKGILHQRRDSSESLHQLGGQ